jgi:Insertion element 4 transposase N-terminal
VVVYLLLAGCLFAELGYGQVRGRMTAGLGGLPVTVPTAAAMTQARRRLGAEPLRELFFLLRGPGPAEARWRGLLAVAIDGTIMTVADSEANLAVYSKQRGGPNGASGYPMLRLPLLVSCGTRTVIDAVFSPVSKGETTCAPGLLGSLRAGMILLADRNESAYFELKSTILGGRVLRARTPGGVDQEVWALLVTYQALRTAIADAAGTVPGADPDRASFTVALNAARDQVILAAGVLPGPAVDLAGTIGRHVLASPMAARRLHISPRVVKRAMSRYNAKGKVDRATRKATVTIAILGDPLTPGDEP